MDVSVQLQGSYSAHRHFAISNILCSGDEETFWDMLIHFHNFGTVAPDYICACNPYRSTLVPAKLVEVISRWDDLFKRAKAERTDVQCMFANTEQGCHSYPDCPFKHNGQWRTR